MMTAGTLCLLAMSFISTSLVRSVPLNKGRGGTREIAYGSRVDYSIAKTSYPFMTRIILDGSFKCGGALISDRFVATARHCLEFCPCFDKTNPSNDWTRCNKLCILKLRENSDFISDTETVHIIKTVHLPENSGNPYETRGQRTDFALIELAESANTCTEEETAQGRCWPVTPVRLPDPFLHIKEGQKVRTLGWGATETSFVDEQSEFLAQLDITVNSTTLFHFLIETNIGPNGADPCKGDSGGPLLLRGDDLDWTLVGTLVGGGYACENPEGQDTTSDWSKITLHVPWITSVMGTALVDKPVTSGTTMDDQVYVGIVWGSNSPNEEVSYDEQSESIKEVMVSTSSSQAGYILSSTGRAAESQGSRLGIYREVEGSYGYSRVYQQAGGSNFIYKTGGKWWCGETVGDGDSSAYLYTSDLFSKSGGWQYWDDAWTQDETLQFLPLTPTSCILQPSILITATGPANSTRPDYLGSFSIVKDVYSAGRPVWRNTKGKVLKMWPGETQFGVYHYSYDRKTGYVRSASGPTCPTDDKAGHSDKYGENAWQYWDGGKVVEDDTIRVQ